MPDTKILGIDLGLSLNKNTTGLCLLNNHEINHLSTVASFNDILSYAKKNHPDIIAIDAPLTSIFDSDEGLYKTRQAELMLMRMQNRFCNNPHFAPQSPNMLINLTIRAMSLTAKIKKLFPFIPIIEVHPTTTWEFLNLPDGKNRASLFSDSKSKWNNFLSALEKRYKMKFPVLKDSIDCPHQVDAFLSALTGLLYLKSHTRNIGEPLQGTITIPQPAKVDAIFFDMDGTLTLTESPWQHIHESLNIWDQRGVKYYEEWLSGKSDYHEFCCKEVGLWNEKHVTLDQIHKYLDKIELNPFNVEVFSLLKKKDISINIISTGFLHTSHRIARQVNWNGFQVFANELMENINEKKGLEAKLNVSADHGHVDSKRNKIRQVCIEKRVPFTRVLAVGDNLIYDKMMFDTCGGEILVSKPEDLSQVLNFFA